MTVCAMFGCKNRMHKGCGKHFFRFPMKDPERLAIWIEAVQRDDWKPSVHSKVCSDHFTEKDYMIRPGAACPYLRTDAVPTPLFIQRKKKTKNRKYTKKSASNTPASNAEEGEMKVDAAQGQMEDTVAQEAAATSKETQEPSSQGQIPTVQPQIKESLGETQEKGPGAETQGAEMAEAQTQAAETQGQIEDQSPTTTEELGKRVVVTRGEQPPSDRMADIDINITTQSERQVALILAELEDTHCEMRAAEARAAREAASIDNQPTIATSSVCNMADCAAIEATSSATQSPNSLADHISFDHAYTTLTMSDKENNVPSTTPASISTPSPVANLKIVKMRKKIKTLQKQVQRQGVKIKSLKQTLVELRRNNVSEKGPKRVISEHCSGLALALFTTQLNNRRKNSSMQYCGLMKDFAMSLYYASPKAYKFCRMFLSLPHQVSLRNWKVLTDTKQEEPQEAVMAAEKGEDPQGEMSQEDILAGALQAVILENETAQNEALPETHTQ